MVNFKRHFFNILYHRLLEKRQFIQILASPRQVGKTTLVSQLADTIGLACMYVSADDPSQYSRRRPGWSLYWNQGGSEVDFILAKGKQLTAIEVKGRCGIVKIPGTTAFCKQYPVNKQLLVGSQGISLEDFLSKPAVGWLE